ncbi:DUF2334 domain-containing protein [Halomarina ordinaria]|uniref:DUF2334 domain-containing protein n=1 Tax=Halomarina ordinaria TaxID=3033939 RepID=A0ABD5U3E1_9EURY|nr:DUF2334 domain-containing protein [Halomarina sp. PSRA2]
MLLTATLVGGPGVDATLPWEADDGRSNTTDARDGEPTGDREATADAGAKTWVEYDSVVVFRNDDIQPYYRAETMRSVDRIFVEEGVPVTLGVVPRAGDRVDLSEGELCPYLRENAATHPGTFEFALHGYTHERLTDFHGGSEFGGLDPAAQRDRLARGTTALTDCVGERPTTFIPPMDTYDESTVEALGEANYTLVSGGGWFTAEYYDSEGEFTDGGLRHVSNDGGFVANWTTGDFHDGETLERRYDESAAADEVHVQMLHYQDFDSADRRTQLRDLIRHMKASGDVAFLTLGELGEHMDGETIRRTDEGWELLEVDE